MGCEMFEMMSVFSQSSAGSPVTRKASLTVPPKSKQNLIQNDSFRELFSCSVIVFRFMCIPGYLMMSMHLLGDIFLFACLSLTLDCSDKEFLLIQQMFESKMSQSKIL